MSEHPYFARNTESLKKQAKKLKKQHQAHDIDAAQLLLSANPELVGHSPEEIADLHLQQHYYLKAVAHQFGFDTWGQMAAYAMGRPRHENGGIVISDTPNLTLLEALNERAALHDMPPIGTRITNDYGIDWEIVNYEFYRTPTTFARYPGDCDYLPVVAPLNISERLRHFIEETDRCTSKRIVFINTMPKAHPLKIGENLHCANYGGDPEESYIFLDVAHAHEVTFAHEIAHLWLIYVNGGDGSRVLCDRSDNGKVNQLDFLQSFILDLKVNDLIAERGFDMSLINQDQISTLTMLRDAINLGHQPPGPREALVNSLSMAAAILEQTRWPEEMKQRLTGLLDFYAVVMPEMHNVARQIVEIVERHGYETQEALRQVLDEVIALGFRATGDDFDLERDLQEPQLNENMQDKYPEQFPGLPVPFKLEIGKTMARHGISGEGQIWISEISGGMAQITVEDGDGNKIGPLPVNYRFTPNPLKSAYRQMHGPNRSVGGKLPDQFGRLPGEIGYNTGSPPGSHPLELTANLVNGMMPDDFGRLPGEPGYNMATPPDLGAFNGMNITAVNGQLLVNGQLSDQHGRLPGHPHYNSPMLPDQDPFNGMLPHLQIPAAAMAAQKRLPGHQWPAAQNQHMLPQVARTSQNVFASVRNPQQLPSQQARMLPEPEQATTELTHRYMAGVGLSVARARLMQQLAANGTNLYQYVGNDPVSSIDPTGLFGCSPSCQTNNCNCCQNSTNICADAQACGATNSGAGGAGVCCNGKIIPCCFLPQSTPCRASLCSCVIAHEQFHIRGGETCNDCGSGQICTADATGTALDECGAYVSAELPCLINQLTNFQLPGCQGPNGAIRQRITAVCNEIKQVCAIGFSQKTKSSCLQGAPPVKL